MKTADEVIGAFDWTPLHERLQADGKAFVRLTWTTDGPRVEVIGPGQMHCATCQCNKIHSIAPVPENPRSRSWHNDAMTEPPKS
jgi:hypothetical protein